MANKFENQLSGGNRFAKEMQSRADLSPEGQKLEDYFQNNYFRNLTREVMSGATFGLDEIPAAGVAGVVSLEKFLRGQPVDFSADYNRIIGRERAASAKFREENPKAALAANVLGAMGNKPLQALMPGGMKVGGKFFTAPAKTLAGRTAQAAVGGGIAGGLYGAGSEGDLGERARRTTTGVLYGTATGAVAQPVVELGATVIGKGVDRLRELAMKLAGKNAAATEGGRRIAQAMARDETTPQRMAARMKTLGPEATVSDAGGVNVAGLAENIAQQPGKGANMAERTIGRRVLGQLGRLENAVDEYLTKANFFSARTGKVAERAANATKAYAEAEAAKPILDGGQIMGLLKNPQIQKAIKQARANPDLHGLPDNHMAVLDAVYKEIGGRAHRTGSYAQKVLRERLRDAIKAENPKYDEAVRQFADDSDILEAMDLGKKIFNMSPEEIGQVLKGYGEPAADAFRIGAADAIKGKMATRSDTANTIRAVFANAKSRNQIRAVFPSATAYRGFQREMMREAQMYETSSRALRGSQTAKRLAMKEDAGVDTTGTLVDVATGNTLGAITKGVRAARNYLARPPARMNEELANVLFSKDASTIERVLNPASKVIRRPNIPARNALGRAVTLGTIANTRF